MRTHQYEPQMHTGTYSYLSHFADFSVRKIKTRVGEIAYKKRFDFKSCLLIRKMDEIFISLRKPSNYYYYIQHGSDNSAIWSNYSFVN